MKKLSVSILTFFLALTFSTPFVQAYDREEEPAITNREKLPDLELTEEQKELLDEKKEELKEKYLTDIEDMTEEEKEEVLKKYKAELKNFMKNELGINLEKPQGPKRIIE